MSAKSINKQMAMNTLLMYFRMFVLILVQLYTIPIVLHALGIEDYGIYSVVGGFVMMFTFINGALVSGCQRFMSFAIGQGDDQNLKDVFETSVYIFVRLAFGLFAIIEIVGVWFLNYHMTVPSERIVAANYVLQFSIMSLIVSIISMPFNAAVIAHERMNVYAFASIFEGLYKLLIAICLTIVLSDKLILYSILMFTSSILLIIVYVYYCRRYFQETKDIKFRRNVSYFREIGSYAGWNIIGSMAIVLRNHGLNVVINLFFSPAMNAAHAIASQLNGLFNQFVNNVYMATRPQMVKQFALGDLDEMWNIAYKSSKYAFFLMVYIVIPVIIELPLFLQLWLHTYPDYTIVFSRLIIFSLLIETSTNQLIGVFQAANKIKYYQSISSIILLGIVPLSYILLKIISNPILPYLLYVLISLSYIISLLIASYRQIGLDVKLYIKKVMIKDFFVFLLAFICTYLIVINISANYWRILHTVILTVIFTSLFIWILGLDKAEQQLVKSIILKKIGEI